MQDRIEVSLPTHFATIRTSDTGEIRNLSPGGLFIATPAIPEVGERIEVHFTAPSGEPVKARGVVWWRTKDRQFYGDATRGFGVQLVDAGEAYRGLLAQHQEKTPNGGR